MNTVGIELALGTVQFGLKYGVAGRGEPIPDSEIRQILERAWMLGIRTLDTASAYGDIETRLHALIGDYPFSVVSKIASIPRGLGEKATEDFVAQAIQKTRARLGERVTALLFHCAEDLLGDQGELIWKTATDALDQTTIRLGVSCYSPMEVLALSARYSIHIVQLPGNALDQRLNAVEVPTTIELHLRSIFLQGLLLLSLEEVRKKRPQAIEPLLGWKKWCNQHGLDSLRACLSVVKSLSNIRYCVVGIDRLAHLDEIAEAWSSTSAIEAPELAINQLDIIDPRRWEAC